MKRDKTARRDMARQVAASGETPAAADELSSAGLAWETPLSCPRVLLLLPRCDVATLLIDRPPSRLLFVFDLTRCFYFILTFIFAFGQPEIAC